MVITGEYIVRKIINMSLTTFFLILAGCGVIGIISAVVADSDKAGIGGTLLLLFSLLFAFISFSSSGAYATKQCIDKANYQKGAQVRIKGIDKAATVLTVQCDDNEKLIRTYEIATTDAVVMKIREDNLENAR